MVVEAAALLLRLAALVTAGAATPPEDKVGEELLFPRTVTVTVAVEAAAQVEAGAVVVTGSVQLSPETKNLGVWA